MKVFAFAAAMALGLSLNGCSAAPAALPKTTPTPNISLSAAEALAKFETLAHASCAKAMAQGVVEKSTAKDGFTLVMVPKDEAFKDFSAAFYKPTDTFELIWETDAFSACSASMQLELAAEGGGEPDLLVEFDWATDTFETTQDLGEFGISHLSYAHSNGLFSGIKTLDSGDADPRTITYGVTEADREILETAVDRYLAKN
jgi:hypothetical protein